MKKAKQNRETGGRERAKGRERPLHLFVPLGLKMAKPQALNPRGQSSFWREGQTSCNTA